METLHVISMKRGATSGSGSPMWRCETREGERVNIFKHSDASRDNFHLFDQAGYAADLEAAPLDIIVYWQQFPIEIGVERAGQFWNIVAVTARPDGAIPDDPYTPDPDFWRAKAIAAARDVFNPMQPAPAFSDVETTGTGRSAEIISLAMYTIKDGQIIPIFDTLIRPDKPERAAALTHVHSITADMLRDAPSFAHVYDKGLENVLDCTSLVVYNADFDPLMLDLACERYTLPPLTPVRIIDAMQIVAWFFHEYEPKWRNFKSLKLTDAAERLGVAVEQAHNASSDAKTMIEVLRKIAEMEA